MMPVQRIRLKSSGSRRSSVEKSIPLVARAQYFAPGGGAGDDNSGYVWQQTFDYTFTDTFALPPASFGPPRFDVFAYVGYAGTSQAAPHLAGLAAMLMQQGITDPAAIEAALEKFATPCSESLNRCDAGVTANRNNTFGFGLIEARSTLRGLGLAK